MADTAIEWTRRPGTRGKTWNPLGGCSDAGVDCANCYAKEMAARIPHMAYARHNQKLFEQYTGLTKKSERGRIQWTGVVRPFPERVAEPLSWKSPCTIFINSMSDLFHEDVPFEFIAAVYGVMAATPQHTYLGLTKRADRKRAFYPWMREQRTDSGMLLTPHSVMRMQAGAHGLRNTAPFHMFSAWNAVGQDFPLPNVWEGASCGVRAGLPRIDELRETPAALRFLSLEPLLEDLGELDLTGISWVIVGGESGHRARACKVEWIRSIVRQCRAAGVPVFVKQLGARYVDEPAGIGGALCKPDAQLVSIRNLINRKGSDMDEWPEDLRVRDYPRAA